MKKKLVVVISHPIQYHAPLYTAANEKGFFDIHVIFINDRGVRPYYEKLSNTIVSYDNDLLRNYSYEFLTKGDPKNVQDKISRLILPELEERIINSNPNAIYFHGYNNIGYIRSIFSLSKKGYKIFIRGENEDILYRPFYRKFFREILINILFKRIAAFLYIGKANYEFYKKRNIPDNKLFFVPYSADNNYFGIDKDLDQKTALRENICNEFKINKNSVIFINTCKHRAEKRPLDLLNAYIDAVKEIGENDTSLLLVGDGPLNKEMRMIASQANSKSIYFTGYVNQSKMRDLLLSSDYCINPAEEPWGCTFNEALPAGLGLISADKVVGWPDMVVNGENGFVFKTGSIKELKELIIRCAKHKELIPLFDKKSREIAAVYSYDVCVKNINSALNNA